MFEIMKIIVSNPGFYAFLIIAAIWASATVMSIKGKEVVLDKKNFPNHWMLTPVDAAYTTTCVLGIIAVIALVITSLI